MPFALLIALAVSLGLHAAALFLTNVDVAVEPEPLPLIAELKRLPPPVTNKPASVPLADEPKVSAKPKPPPKKKKPKRKPESAPVVSAPPVLAVPAESSETTVPAPDAPTPVEFAGDQSAAGGAGDPAERAAALRVFDHHKAPGLRIEVRRRA